MDNTITESTLLRNRVVNEEERHCTCWLCEGEMLAKYISKFRIHYLKIITTHQNSQEFQFTSSINIGCFQSKYQIFAGNMEIDQMNCSNVCKTLKCKLSCSFSFLFLIHGMQQAYFRKATSVQPLI